MKNPMSAPHRALPLVLLLLPLSQLACDGGGIRLDDTTSADDSAVPPVDLQITEVSAEVDAEMVTLIHVEWTVSHASNTWVEFHDGDEDWRQAPTLAAEAGPQRSLILGVPALTDVTWRIVAEAGDVRTETEEEVTATWALPGLMPDFELAESDPTLFDEGYLFGTLGTESINQWVLYGLNRDGEIVWYHVLDSGFWSPYMRMGRDGKSILFNARNTREDDRRIYRIAVDGTVLEEWQLPGLSHAFAELDGGVIAYPREVGVQEDVTLVHPDGSTEVVFSCDTWLVAIGQGGFPCYHNALNWQEDRGTFLYSFYNLNSVLEFDLESGEPLRWFGQARDSYSFGSDDTRFDFQHHPTYTSRGGFMVTTSDPGNETWAVEYEVDDEGRTLSQFWHYGEGERLKANTIGEATRLDNDNTLINWGSTTHIREVTLDGETAWDGQWARGGFLGSIHAVDDIYDLYRPVEPDTL